MTQASAPYRDPGRSPEARARDLLSRMTLDEKLAQLVGVWSTALRDADAFSEEKAEKVLAQGIGHVTRIAAAGGAAPRENARLANAIQRHLRERTRLAIPAVVHEESCAGFTARGGTCFPQAIGLAASFDPALVTEVGTVIREQMRAVGARHTLAPVLDVARDPRWGRMEETFGEDPYLVAQMGIAYVRGVQGGDLADGVVCTGKHFIAYGASEGGLNWAPAHAGARELRDVHAWPFHAAIREAGIASMMNSYGEVDGVPCGASREILHDLLRDELGFDGTLVSDYFTVATLVGYHGVAVDKADAARQALEAGIDVELPAADCYGEPLRKALADGRIDPALVDRAVLRVLRQKFELGLFERPFVDEEAAPAAYGRSDQIELAQRAAERSIVLLRNEDELLPIAASVRRIAVIGPNADSARAQQGDYHYPAHLEMLFGPIREGDASPRPGPAQVDLASLVPPTTTVQDGIRAIAPGAQIAFARGSEVAGSDRSGFAEAIEAARGAEVAIVVVGGRSGLVAGCTSGESIDRCTLGLPGVQQELVEAVHATGTPTVAVVIDGRPLALPWIAANVPAVLHAFVPGERGGAAIARVLFGVASPGGRLPVSMPIREGQIPVFHGHKASGGRSHWQGTYVDGAVLPLFPFGHGLSYGRFRYEHLLVSPAEPRPTGAVEVACDVVNEGTLPGDEVVQLYVRDPVASVTRPVRELLGFVRISLQPGERRRIRFLLHVEQLAFHDRSRRLVVEPGRIDVMIGASAADIRLRGHFEIAPPGTSLRARERFTTSVVVE